MVVLRGPVTFQMGSPESEPGRDPIETRHAEPIPRSFAISAHEVTAEQYLLFEPNAPYAPEIAPQGTCPANKVSWFDAVRYCNWLSGQEGFDASEMCYPPDDQIGPDMVLPEDFLSRPGYRLPTEAEWEYACRGGADSRWFFGENETRLPDYGWYLVNSGEHTWPVGRCARMGTDCLTCTATSWSGARTARAKAFRSRTKRPPYWPAARMSGRASGYSAAAVIGR